MGRRCQRRARPRPCAPVVVRLRRRLREARRVTVAASARVAWLSLSEAEGAAMRSRIYRFPPDVLVNVVDALALRVALQISAAQQCAAREAHGTTAL
jgi:hypothetical protein